MKRNWKMAVCLLLAAMTLCACSSEQAPEDFPDITQALGPTATPTAAPTPVPQMPEAGAGEFGGGDSIFSANPYDVDMTGLTADAILSEFRNFIEAKEQI